MTRKHALSYARVAGYHEDTKGFTRLVIENRVSRKVMQDAYSTGQAMRAAGVPCNCHDCKPKL